MMTFRFLIVCFFFVKLLTNQQQAYAQKENVFLHPKKFYKKFFPKLKIKPNPPDSIYIKSYPKYLALNAHVLSPSIRLNIVPRGEAMGASHFKSNIADIIGIAATYKLVSAGFAFSLKSGVQVNRDYARGHYRTATIKYGSGFLAFQFKYLRFEGLTDVNSSNSLIPNRPYIKRPDIVGKEFQFEGLLNFSWKKYSYIAPLTFAQRQLKTRVGFLLKPGIYYSGLHGDSALIARNQQPYFVDFNDIKEIRTLYIKLAPGVGGNFIFFKRFYFSVAFFPSYDLYLYKYLSQPKEKVKGKQTFVLVLDEKASIGYQSKRLYACLRYETERRNASLYNAKTKYAYTYLGVELGYRFNTPRIVKKIYKDTMPPDN